MKDIIPHDLGEGYSEMLLKCLDVEPRKRIGLREMMGYLFSKEELHQLAKESKNASCAKEAVISIPTTITEG